MSTIRPGWVRTSDGLGVEGEFHGHRWTIRTTQNGEPPVHSPRETLGTVTRLWVSRDGGPWHESCEKDVLATLRGIETNPGHGREVRFGAPPFDAVATLADGTHLDIWYDEVSGDATEVTSVHRGEASGVMFTSWVGPSTSRDDLREKVRAVLHRRGYDVVSVEDTP